jgi:uncharacterized protein YgiM (DUF1202 family)
MTNWFCDMSYWQSSYSLEKFKLLKTYGMVAAIHRAGYATTKDTLVDTLVSYSRTTGTPYGLYWYLYPSVSAQSQATAFANVCKQFPDAKSFFIDAEHYANGSGVSYSPDFLNTFYRNVYTYTTQAMPGKKVGIYSAAWCVDNYFPKLASLIQAVPYWNASYIKYAPWWRLYIASLGGSWADSSKLISISNLPNIMTEIEKHNAEMVLPKGVSHWEAWQCITFIPFSELGKWERNLDYNIAPATTYKEWFGIDVGVVPPPVVEEPEPPKPPYVSKQYAVTATNLNIRTSPNTTSAILGTLPRGTIITSLDESNGWILMNVGWLSKTYLQEVITNIGEWYVANQTVNIRPTPDTTKAPVGHLDIGQKTIVNSITNGWAKLNQGGYVYAVYLTKM